MTVSRRAILDRLAVDTGGDFTGFLDRSQVKRESTLFTYADVPAEKAVSLVMPVRRDPYIWPAGLHPIFEMNLPEGELRQALIRRFSKVAARFDDFDLLAVVGPHQLGRVAVYNPASRENSAPVSLNELLTYSGTEDLVEYLMSTYAPYSGVSGVQPKVLVRDAATAEVERITERTATHIVKAWRADQFPHLATNEYFCLRAAEAAGLPAPEFALSSDGQLLAVKRFDLPSGGAYLGFEDLGALNGWTSDRKYEGSYEHCAKQLRTFVSPGRQRAAMEQFFASLVLSCALKNGDAHRKNFGVLYPDGAESADVSIAPIYDIVTTTVYLPNDTLALLLAGSKRWPKASALANFGRTACGLSEGTVRALMEQVGDGIATARHELLAHAEQNPGFKPIAERMELAWNTGRTLSLRPDTQPTISLGSTPSGRQS